VAVLTSDLTISAGETFTQALMNRRPAPVRIGTATQGVFSDTMDRHLPKGWLFELPNEEYLTAAHTTFDGTGIPPDKTTPVFTPSELSHNRDSAVDTVIALLSKAR
jgi:C-terminal processing protease CtpA/Prc